MSFRSEWRKAAASAAPQDPIAGRWEGRWLSDVNGHTGRLRCILEPRGGSRYQAYYHATFWKIFSYAYRVEMEVQTKNGTWEFRGSKDLGWLGGGEYEYSGHIKGEHFSSTYQSKSDKGTFELRRVNP